MEFSVGLILLGVLIICMFFGVFRRLFDRMNMGIVWVAVALITLGVGFAIPSIVTGAYFAFNIGGAIIANIFAVMLILSLGFNFKMLRAVLANIAVIGITILVLMSIPQHSLGLRILVAFVLGIAAGGISYLTAGTYKGAMFGVIMGILSGQLITWGINRGIGYASFVNYGGGYIFDAMIIGLVFATLTAELIRMAAVKKSRMERRHNFAHEQGEDMHFDYTKDPKDFEPHRNFLDKMDDDLHFGD